MNDKKLVMKKDGDEYCVLWGNNLQEGISGFGYTPAEAMSNFFENVSKDINSIKSKSKNYSNLAEVWFGSHYLKMTLSEHLKTWWSGIDPRLSVLINFSRYIGNLKSY